MPIRVVCEWLLSFVISICTYSFICTCVLIGIRVRMSSCTCKKITLTLMLSHVPSKWHSITRILTIHAYAKFWCIRSHRRISCDRSHKHVLCDPFKGAFLICPFTYIHFMWSFQQRISCDRSHKHIRVIRSKAHFSCVRSHTNTLYMWSVHTCKIAHVHISFSHSPLWQLDNDTHTHTSKYQYL